MDDEKLLDIRGLYTQYDTDDDVVYAVNNLSLSLSKGRTLGLVGETGAGKTTTCLSILRLLPDKIGKITAGEIYFDGKNLIDLHEEDMRQIRGNDIAMIFQHHMTSLDTTMKIRRQITDSIMFHTKLYQKEALDNGFTINERCWDT